MVLSLIGAAIGVGATAALAILAVRVQALTSRAGAIAFAFGALIVVVGGFPFLVLLVLFVLGSVLATRYRFEEKVRRNVQEGTRGERGVSNVLSHVVIPTALVVGGWLIPSALPPAALGLLYTTALAFGASDTFASEIGVLAGGARSILTGRPVPPGTNGGISAWGELWGFLGALITAVAGLILFAAFSWPLVATNVFLLVVTGSGFLGCQIDSVVGEGLENRGLLTKGGTNLVAMFASSGIAAAILVGAGVSP